MRPCIAAGGECEYELVWNKCLNSREEDDEKLCVEDGKGKKTRKKRQEIGAWERGHGSRVGKSHDTQAVRPRSAEEILRSSASIKSQKASTMSHFLQR